jgi:hypothetical protein
VPQLDQRDILRDRFWVSVLQPTQIPTFVFLASGTSTSSTWWQAWQIASPQTTQLYRRVSSNLTAPKCLLQHWQNSAVLTEESNNALARRAIPAASSASRTHLLSVHWDSGTKTDGSSCRRRRWAMTRLRTCPKRGI